MYKAGCLQYTNRGFGTVLNVNNPDGTGQKDCASGPSPLSFSYKPIGPNAAVIEWAVETTIPACAQSGGSGSQVLAYNYKIDFGVDNQGFTSRTISGEVWIPLTRSQAGATNVPGNVDSLFESVNPPVPPGFRRTTRNHTVSSDRRSLSFTIVDEELPTFQFQDGVVEAPGLHDPDRRPQQPVSLRVQFSGDVHARQVQP